MGLARWDYKCTSCGLRIEESFNESTFVGPCPWCSLNTDEPIRLFKKVFYSPSMARVWHGHWNMTTGTYLTDRKQFKESLHAKSEEVSERLNGPHNFIEIDPRDVGATDEGLDATHDRHVDLGWKESKGQFVFPMSEKKAPDS